MMSGEFSAGLASIGKSAFKDCVSLTGITLSSGSIGSMVLFLGAAAMTPLPGMALFYSNFRPLFVASFIASFVDFPPSLQRVSDKAHDKARDKVHQSHRLKQCHSSLGGWCM